MKAMILAAGLGTRLKPFTDSKPKALVEINGKTLLQITIERLQFYGFKSVCINIHHFASQIRNYLEANNNFGMDISLSDETDLLLDTGGGIRKALPLLGNKPFLVHNVDIVSNVNLYELYHDHNIHPERAATICVSERNSSRYLIFDSNNHLVGWEKPANNEIKLSRSIDSKTIRYAYNGIAIIDPECFRKSRLTGVFSVIDFFLEQAEKQIVKAFIHNGLIIDAGRPENLSKINNHFTI